MKTYILRLEPHDDFVSTRDKMAWAKAERILLVWPARGEAILARQLDLALLHRQAQALGARLTLVTRSREVRFYARQLGIPTFSSLRKAQRARWWAVPPAKSPRPYWPPEADDRPRADLTPPKRGAPLPFWLRILAFTLGVAAILILSAALAPAAQIRLTPRQAAQELTLSAPVALPSAIGKPGTVPSDWERVEVEGRAAQPASGVLMVPAQRAGGRVTFANLTQSPVFIPVGTVVRTAQTPGVRFAVTQPGETPAGPGATLSLPLEALSAGAGGNLPADSLTAIEGELGLLLSATNAQPTRGGGDRRLPAPSQKDRDALLAELTTALQQTALAELEQKLLPGDVLLSDSLRQVEVLEVEFFPAAEQPADQVELSLRLVFEALVIRQADLQQLANAGLDAALPDGFQAVPGSLAIEILARPEITAGQMTDLTLGASRQTAAILNPAQAVSLALGQSPQAAGANLQNALPLAHAPEIVLQPAWWPRLPLAPLRVQVQVAAPAQTPAPPPEE